MPLPDPTATPSGVAQRPVRRWHADTPEAHDVFQEPVVVEEPLELRVDGEPLVVTLRTPGDDLDLVVGFLRTEGLIEDLSDLSAVAHVGTSGNVVDTVLAGGVAAHRAALTNARRALMTTSGCGLCGKATIAQVHLHAPPLPARPDPDPALVVALPEHLRALQPVFAQTGGLHGAALFSPDGALLVSREDIGRHNAVDKVIGAALRRGHPTDGTLLVVSGRAGFELAQKALVARARALIAVGAASHLAIDLATQSGLGLYGFVRDGRAVRYS